jgi:DNA helicase-2/ATP-dependent DNA helicase PcrA
LQFEEDYPDATTILLEQNYRSTQNILSAANAVISLNEDRKEKNLWSEAGSGPKIIGFVAENEHHEAEFVRDELNRASLKKFLCAQQFLTKLLAACDSTNVKR